MTWGTTPGDVAPITGTVPDPAKVNDPAKKLVMEKALAYMGLTPGSLMESLEIHKVFIGSCTNSRIEDLRSAAAVLRGRKVAAGVEAMVAPGSGVVKKQAEAGGLDRVFKDSGFDWREPGCSMCLGMNPDRVGPQQRCASISNKNFEGRQGVQARTHLMSPAMAAAAAVVGTLKNVRTLLRTSSENGDGVPTKSLDFYQREFIPAEPSTRTPIAASSGSAGFTSFTRLESVMAAPFRRENVDTDCILPKQFLKKIKRTGLGKAVCFRYRVRG